MNKSLPAITLGVALVSVLISCGSGAGISPTSAPATTAPTAEPAEPTSAPPTPEPPTAAPPPAEMAISTTAFEPDGDIPERHTCVGDNVSPQLEWVGIPAEAQSLLLFFYDPDAGFDSGASVEPGFVHWVVYNIPPTVAGLPEDVPAGAALANGALQGSNDFARFASEGDTFPGGSLIKMVGYDGPCPGNKHQYVFALRALDAMLDLPKAPTPSQVLEALEGHVVDQAEVAGFYTPPSQ